MRGAGSVFQRSRLRFLLLAKIRPTFDAARHRRCHPGRGPYKTHRPGHTTGLGLPRPCSHVCRVENEQASHLPSVRNSNLLRAPCPCHASQKPFCDPKQAPLQAVRHIGYTCESRLILLDGFVIEPCWLAGLQPTASGNVVAALCGCPVRLRLRSFRTHMSCSSNCYEVILPWAVAQFGGLGGLGGFGGFCGCFLPPKMSSSCCTVSCCCGRCC